MSGRKWCGSTVIFHPEGQLLFSLSKIKVKHWRQHYYAIWCYFDGEGTIIKQNSYFFILSTIE